MAITSQLRGTGAFGERVVEDWQAAKLIRPRDQACVATLEQTLIIKKFGQALCH